MFHGTVHAADGPHARWNRAAALQAHALVADAVGAHGVAGAADGLLRIETELDLAAMHALVAAQALPPDYVRVLDAVQAAALAGVAVPHPAWFYPGGGWVAPAALAAAMLRRAGASAGWRGATAVHALARRGDGWALLDAAGRVLDEAPTVVLASAHDTLRLAPGETLVLESVRGQLSGLPLATWQAAGAAAPRLPLAGHGYVLPALDGQMWFGATARPGDGDAALREADHRHNLAQLPALIGHSLGIDPSACGGRVGWRCSSRDRLPLIGAWPDPADHGELLQPRLVKRLDGLFVFTALGSRGITWSALGARLLASWVCGAPSPVEAGLLEAVDPARFVTRAARREVSLRSRSTPAAAG